MVESHRACHILFGHGVAEICDTTTTLLTMTLSFVGYPIQIKIKGDLDRALSCRHSDSHERSKIYGTPAPSTDA